jgi:hypothetical protein
MGTVFVPWSSCENFYVSFCDCFVLSSASFLDSSETDHLMLSQPGYSLSVSFLSSSVLASLNLNILSRGCWATFCNLRFSILFMIFLQARF